MGYGWLGSYLAFGFGIEKEKANKIIEEDMEVAACLFMDEEFTNIVIKEYGFDDSSYFLLWRPCFHGGEVWGSKVEENMVEDDINVERMKEIESSYDPAVMKKFCEKHDLEYKDPKWKMLYCMGQWIY